jgi:hypothetical protein
VDEKPKTAAREASDQGVRAIGRGRVLFAGPAQLVGHGFAAGDFEWAFGQGCADGLGS